MAAASETDSKPELVLSSYPATVHDTSKFKAPSVLDRFAPEIYACETDQDLDDYIKFVKKQEKLPEKERLKSKSCLRYYDWYGKRQIGGEKGDPIHKIVVKLNGGKILKCWYNEGVLLDEWKVVTKGDLIDSDIQNPVSLPSAGPSIVSRPTQAILKKFYLIKGYQIFVGKTIDGDLEQTWDPYDVDNVKKVTDIAKKKAKAAKKAHSSYYNNLDYRSLFDDSAQPIHHQYENGLQVHSSHQYEDGEYYNGLLLGGVIGGGSIVAILVVFCLGLAFGMLVCFGYQQKKALEERKKEDWRQDDDV